MRPIQISMDESLLERIDGDSEAQSLGRSAFLRYVVARYLDEKRERDLVEAYRRAYSGGPVEDLLLPPIALAWPDE